MTYTTEPKYKKGDLVLSSYHPSSSSRVVTGPQPGRVLESPGPWSYTLEMPGGWTDDKGRECWHVDIKDIVGLVEADEETLYY